jgi:SAM-dependent methyltransferase
MTNKPDYGIDAPGVIRNFLLLGAGLIIAGNSLSFINIGPARLALGRMAIITGSIFLAEALLMLAYAKIGKFFHRDRILAKISWKGTEQVLDVGTGRGLLMNAAAKSLSTGKAIGIDIWNASDLSDNNVENTLRNADIEGVKEKVELRNEDAQKMTFADSSFDVVLSNLCLHNIPTGAGRTTACQEIARVLKPGGVAVISDFKNTADYEKVFRAAGLNTERSAPYLFSTFPPLRIVTARK